MNGWIVALIALNFASLLINATKHGKEKTGKENVWYGLISSAITWTILWQAGLFN